jgi:hypothetical protein
VVNDELQGAREQHHHHLHEASYSNFLAMHPPMFAEAMDPLEINNWLHVIKAKFKLLCCSEIQKTLFTAQQHYGSAGAWWATFTATLPADY